MKQWVDFMCVYAYVCARECVHMSVCVVIWGFAAVGALLLMAAHCSPSLCVSASLSRSQPVYGPSLFLGAHRN